MSNLFLPPFPQEGLTNDYIDIINSIFTAISTHTHVSVIADVQTTYPEGNVIQSDSVNWSGNLSVNSMQNMFSIGIENISSTPADNSIYSTDIYSNLYFKKVGFSPIKITNNLFVNFSQTIVGIGGPINLYGVSLFFDTVANGYTFSYNAGLLSIIQNTLNVTTLQASTILCNTITLTNAPNVPPLNGYIYFNQNSNLVYTLTPIRLDKTIRASALIFDNPVTYNFPPQGFTYIFITNITNFINLIQYTFPSGSEPITTVLNFYVTDGVWCPIVTNDELVSGIIKEAFYCEPFSQNKAGIWKNSEIYSIQATKERWVWNLVNQLPYSQFTRVMHYTFNLYNPSVNPTGIPLPITNWNDCLIENTTAGGLLEKYILIDIFGTPNIQFNMKFHYMYDMGATAV